MSRPICAPLGKLDPTSGQAGIQNFEFLVIAVLFGVRLLMRNAGQAYQ